MERQHLQKTKTKGNRIANLLIIIGLLFIAIPTGFWLNAMQFQWVEAQKWRPQLVSQSDDYIRTLKQAGKNEKALPAQASGEGQQSSAVNGDRKVALKDLVDTRAVKSGASIAYLEIPRLDIKSSVLEGSTRANLIKGCARVSNTARVGDHGTVLIAGHRTMYGAPFHELHKVKLGDKITVYTKKALFIYTVSGIKRVLPDDWSDIKEDVPPRLVLSTCEPMYSSEKRLLIIANLSDARKL